MATAARRGRSLMASYPPEAAIVSLSATVTTAGAMDFTHLKKAATSNITQFTASVSSGWSFRLVDGGVLPPAVAEEEVEEERRSGVKWKGRWMERAKARRREPVRRRVSGSSPAPVMRTSGGGAPQPAE
nr:unnamed protein product [Digitaria exilis]